MYHWSLSWLKFDDPLLGRVGWAVAFLYAACAALRLARFNTQVAVVDKRWFVGLASPRNRTFLCTVVLDGVLDHFKRHASAVATTDLFAAASLLAEQHARDLACRADQHTADEDRGHVTDALVGKRNLVTAAAS